MPQNPSERPSEEPTRAMATPPDAPRVPPAAPRAPMPAPARPVAATPLAGAPVVDVGVLERLHESVRTLRVLVALLAVLALAGLVLSVLALRSDDDSRTGASRARVERVDDRVSRLKRQVQDLRSTSTTGASATDVATLRRQVAAAATASDVQSLRRTVSDLGAQGGGSSGSTTDPQPALDALGRRIDGLEQQVRQLQDDATAP